MAAKYKAPRGTQDILPKASWRWQHVEATFRDICRCYSYQEIRTPIFEDTDLFIRGTGETTEIVNKQMYTFEDRGGRSLTLRPEGTPSVVRAYLEHHLGASGGTRKFCYIAPIFRYERPQAGRLRQHHQLGVEAIGAPGPEIDAEVIALYHHFLHRINLQGGVTHLSSIGCPACRPGFQDALRAFFASVIGQMCNFCQARYDTNPLRILDCKVPRDVELRQGAPGSLDHLCQACQRHFEGLRATLDALGISFEVDPTIVRGLDYYTRTAFEVVHSALGAKDVLMGGGRYDGLAEMLGGPPTPGIGFGAGLERLLMVLDASLRSADSKPAPGQLDVYIAAAAPEARQPALQMAIELRSLGLAVDLDFVGRSLGSQMREASRLGARFAALIGEDELRSDQITARDMETGQQETIPRGQASQQIAIRLARPKGRT